MTNSETAEYLAGRITDVKQFVDRLIRVVARLKDGEEIALTIRTTEGPSSSYIKTDTFNRSSNTGL